jgi:hypothetical protein
MAAANPPAGELTGTASTRAQDDAKELARKKKDDERRLKRRIDRLTSAGVLIFVALVIAVLLASMLPRLVVPLDLRSSPELIGHVLIVIALAVAIGGLIVYEVDGYLAGIFVVFAIGPAAGGVVAVMTYLLVGGEQQTMSIRAAAAYDGFAASVAAVAILALVGVQLSTPKRAQARTYDSLRDRYNQLLARYEVLGDLEKTAPDPDPDRRIQNRILLKEACSRLEEAERDLCDANQKQPALRWALATGYSSLQRTLHRVEEMIVAAQPDYAVTGDSLHDALRLSESTIADHDTLSAHLRTAMQTISRNSANTFFRGRGASVPPRQEDLPTCTEAREVLREVRFAVNDFRDDRVDGLIRARNRLLWVVLIVATVAYLALGLGMINGVTAASVSAVSILYLVAALAGLINRLRIESMRSTAVEDYGLHLARLIAAPLLSGLAGVAGVYLVAKTPELLTLVSPIAAPTGGAPATTTVTPLDVSAIFDLQRNQAALLVAAIFGLVPSQLISSLQRQAERFQVDLERSEPSGGATQTQATT